MQLTQRSYKNEYVQFLLMSGSVLIRKTSISFKSKTFSNSHAFFFKVFNGQLSYVYIKKILLNYSMQIPVFPYHVSLALKFLINAWNDC